MEVTKTDKSEVSQSRTMNMNMSASGGTSYNDMPDSIDRNSDTNNSSGSFGESSFHVKDGETKDPDNVAELYIQFYSTDDMLNRHELLPSIGEITSFNSKNKQTNKQTNK